MAPHAPTDGTRFLLYHNYCSGKSGLSNGIMSIEIGVILAFLMGRRLVIEGNISPTANVVDYGERVGSREPSRVTDLLDLPHGWTNAEDIDLEGLDSCELSEVPLLDSVFVHPPDLDVSTADFASFANGRRNVLSDCAPFRDASVLRLSGGPGGGKDRLRNFNLNFYSYFFYLGEPSRGAVHELMARMQPKDPFAELAGRIANDLGRFNAAHVRRGDFKVTSGVTVASREPREALEALDRHFDRQERLVLLTDDADDPFFDSIDEAYSDCIFLDHFILEHYAEELSALPRQDAIALAFLSQRVAVEARDFVGSMKSTFTALIHRWRGNRNGREPFQFLWSELPEDGGPTLSEQGVMIERGEEPYTWNRIGPGINPAWMREWPEGFVDSPHGGEPSDHPHGGKPSGQ